MQIGTLATTSGLSRDTLRYYEKFGLIRANRSENGYRQYTQETLDTLKYIQIGQELGFSLGEIRENLQLIWNCEDRIDDIVSLLLTKAEEIEARIQHLSALKASIHEHIAHKLSTGTPCEQFTLINSEKVSAAVIPKEFPAKRKGVQNLPTPLS